MGFRQLLRNLRSADEAAFDRTMTGNLRAENQRIHEDNYRLREENVSLKTRVAELEAVVEPLEELLADGEEITGQYLKETYTIGRGECDDNGVAWWSGRSLAAALAAAVAAKKGAAQ